MITAQDFKGRKYEVLEMSTVTTLLRCMETSDRIRVRSWGWEQIGFYSIGGKPRVKTQVRTFIDVILEELDKL